MRLDDNLRFGTRSLTTHRARAWLTLLAMALGTAAVILLSALGEGARLYVLGEFTQLGTHLVIVLPGRNETTGGPPPLLGETPRDLTLDDAVAIGRSRLVKRFAPIVVGSAPVSSGSLSREVTILGSTSDFLEVRNLELGQGRFLPPGDPERGRPVAVLGARLAGELFGQGQALGRWVRIGDRRYRVIGILGTDGESLGMDMGDLAIIPVASAQSLFDSPALFRILVQAPSRSALPEAKEADPSHRPRAPRGRGRRHRHHPGRAAHHLRQDPQRPHPGRGRHRRHQPDGGRGVDHERDAGGGLPAHRGSRTAQGPGGGASARSWDCSSPRPCCWRGRVPRRGWCWHSRACTCSTVRSMPFRSWCPSGRPWPR